MGKSLFGVYEMDGGNAMQKVDSSKITIDAIIDKIKTYNPTCNEPLIRSAYELAAKCHEGQKRDSGEPYIVHPLSVAYILADLNMDDTTIMAGLLHDVVEDTNVTLDQIAEKYGSDMKVLIDGVTKLDKLEYRSKKEHHAENLRKMFLAMAKDVRIILIKLADRLHNMRTLGSHRSDLRKKEIALETLEIFAPLAHRLGIYKIKWELEDLSLKFLDPEAYFKLVKEIDMKRTEREQYLNTIIEKLQFGLEKVNIKADISGRPKNFYSIYRKMQKQMKDISEIYDIHAVRIIVNSVKDCYGALGVVHTIWKPIPGRFKDYIAMPKANMYQSIHTTVIGTSGHPFEVQIRTWEMHKLAEYGIAAHWKYKEGTQGDSASDNRLNFLRQMLDWQQEVNAQEFVDDVKGDLIDEVSVFVFSPNGDVYELPSGACPIDFAYRVHTQVGHQCVGAKINGRIVPLDTKLSNGDIVEILTTRGSGPSRDWLKICKTTQAKNKIRQWFRREGRDEHVIQKGREMLEKEAKRQEFNLENMFKVEKLSDIAKRCGYVSSDDLMVAIATNAITTLGVISKIRDDERLRKNIVPEVKEKDKVKEMRFKPFAEDGSDTSKGITVRGVSDVMVKLANCCNPLPGDEIIGYITRGKGVSIHRVDCPNMKYYAEHQPERFVDVRWGTDGRSIFQAEIAVEGTRRTRLAMDVMSAISETKTVINGVNFDVDQNEHFTGRIKLEIKNLEQLEYIMNKVRKIKGIEEVRRVYAKGQNKAQMSGKKD